MFLRVRALLFFLMFYNLFFRAGETPLLQKRVLLLPQPTRSSSTVAYRFAVNCRCKAVCRRQHMCRWLILHVPMAKFYFAIYQT